MTISKVEGDKVIGVVTRGLVAFGRFWWDFLIGDTPELFVATLAVIGSAYGLRHQHDVAIVVVPLVAIVFLGLSTYNGRKRVAPR